MGGGKKMIKFVITYDFKIILQFKIKNNLFLEKSEVKKLR